MTTSVLYRIPQLYIVLLRLIEMSFKQKKITQNNLMKYPNICIDEPKPLVPNILK